MDEREPHPAAVFFGLTTWKFALLEDIMSAPKPPDETPKWPLTDRQAYNLVTDTVVGPNVRLKDNLYQGLAILVGLLLGVGIGLLVTTDRVTGALLGGFIGLLAGLFGSGLFLMVYRAVRHVRGKHD
jgi:hypothetical protein